MYLFIENIMILADDDKGLVVTVMVSETNLDCFYLSFIPILPNQEYISFKLF